MNSRTLQFDDVVRFHGHACPGLAVGYRMASAAIHALGIDTRSGDEELVAIVENDACGVDAIQFMTGCTFGKGNLIFHDFGKMACTLIRRNNGKAVRIRIRNDLPELEMSRDQRVRWLLEIPDSDLLECEDVQIEIPSKAHRIPSIRCAICGEKTMETRIVANPKGPLCIPCSRMAD
ncbi:TraR/DksA C4-type zinc finger protein [bacterium]|nr:TraR/DksA C4-type zinc finger protein [candidate division CSSED10-310 bacterium]